MKIILKNKWKRIKLVDRFLIVIMIILISYSVSTLVINNTEDNLSKNIDTVARSTIASIFGYFISFNFTKNEKSFEGNEKNHNKNENNTPNYEPIEMADPSSNQTTVTNKIGFTAGDTTAEKIDNEQQVKYKPSKIDFKEGDTVVGKPNNSQRQTIAAKSSSSSYYEEYKTNSLQIFIIGILCICSLCVLIYTRYFIDADDHALSISQFRDIVCGSIGFLIGIPAD